MKSPDDLREFYRTDLRPALEPFETRRRSILRRLYVTAGVVLAASAGALALGSPQGAPAAALLALIPGAIVFALVAYFSLRGYAREFKTAIVGQVAEFIDPSLGYHPERHVSESQFRASRLFERGVDRYSGEDYVSGKLGATAVEFSEVHAEYKTRGSKGEKHWHTIFKGLFFIADFNKDFKGTTVVVPDVAERLLGGWLGKLMQKMNIARSGQLIKLEDPRFERHFAVYADDQVEARYILTPSMMERLVEFRERPETGDQVFISFARSNVNVAIPSRRDMFEPHLMRTLLDFKLIEEYFLDLSLAAGIVEDLNLNTRIWTKR